jgi:hydrophobe/amphiphile efflux-1 (HAE1) family protein
MKLGGRNTAGVGVYQLAGANAVEIADQTRAAMEDLSKRFPEGMTYEIAYDTTMFVRESIKEVLITLGLALLLVIGVIFIFLQDWRSTVIPCVAIPVSLIGTFGLMLAFGFTINTLTLFGLVLAIGLVVDDAIVVVENISRIIETEGLPPLKAAMKGMAEVVSPVIATSLVLFAVFVPVAFMPGISGALYRQFALTIAFSVGISTICALSLSPAMSAIVLRKKAEGGEHWFFAAFNKGFELSRRFYLGIVRAIIARWKTVLAAFAILLVGAFYMLHKVPTAFVPPEDMGYFYVIAQGPEGTSIVRTEQVTHKIEKIAAGIDGVDDVLTIGGYNMISGALDSSSASVIVVLKEWNERRSPEQSIDAIMQTMNMRCYGLINEATAFAFSPPPIMGLSTTGGFQFMLQDYEGRDVSDLYDVAQGVIDEGQRHPELDRLSTTFKVNYPQIYIDLDRTKAKSLGISLSDIFNTLQAYLGSIYVNDFNKFGRIYRVFAQAKEGFRSDSSDISRLYVRSAAGDLVPLSALVEIRRITGAQNVMHYNIFRSVEIDGDAAPGHSSGEAISAMEQIAKKVLPQGYGFEWTGTALQEIKSAGLAPFIFALALAFVFLFLSAQYESWSLPIIIMVSVPLAILGALVAQWWRGLYDDVYCQIGLVMLIGLASKNAILLVEFAKDKREEGMGIVEAAMEAARLRLRPILMTALSFILGVVPLVIATGAGASARHSLGTAVFGGMMASTFLSLGVVPVLFVVIEGLKERGVTMADARAGWAAMRHALARLCDAARWIAGWLRRRKAAHEAS